MSESVNIENKKQNHQKPPLSVIRITGEILTGTATGLVVALPIAYVTDVVLVDTKGHYVAFELLVMFVIVFPLLYGLASAVGVYLVGTSGKQTGSFLLTLVGGFLGGFFILVMLPFLAVLSKALIVGVEKIVLWAIGVLILLSPPIIATIGFNLRRRYKEQPSP